MSNRIHQAIKKILENNPELTQKGLASHLGVNPAAVNRMLYGKRNIKVHEVPIIEDYLGVRLDLLHSNAPEGLDMVREQYMIPVYNEQEIPIEWVAAHPQQSNFAIYVVSEEMEPRYFQGELVYAHKDKPPQTSRDCIIKTKDGKRRIRQFIKHENQAVHTRSFNPAQKECFNDSDIVYICAIVGRS